MKRASQYVEFDEREYTRPARYILHIRLCVECPYVDYSEYSVHYSIRECGLSAV